MTSKELMGLPLFTRNRILDNRDTNLSPFVYEVRLFTNKSEFPEWAKSDLIGIPNILTADNVNVRAEPNKNGTVLLKLKKGAKVVVINRQDEEVTLGDKTGRWAYIDTGG